MKTPDEIKDGLERCNRAPGYKDCKNCPYFEILACTTELRFDTLALIQQYEKTIDNLAEANAAVHKKCDSLRLRVENREESLRYLNNLRDAAAGRALEMEERVHQLEAERDAALADFKLYRERNIKGECGVYACDLCKRGGRYEDWDEIKCPTGCSGVSHWEWRGVQKEESDA